MRPGRTQQRLERLEAALGCPAQGGMHRISASAVYRQEQRWEPRLIRLMRHLANRQFAERFMEWKLGDSYVPTWELSRAERIEVRAALHEVALRHVEWSRGQPELQAQMAKEKEERLEGRRKVEKDRGQPVAFLYPCDAERLQGSSKPRPLPVADTGINFGRLTPVYADGTVGDPLLYSVHDAYEPA